MKLRTLTEHEKESNESKGLPAYLPVRMKGGAALAWLFARGGEADVPAEKKDFKNKS